MQICSLLCRRGPLEIAALSSKKNSSSWLCRSSVSIKRCQSRHRDILNPVAVSSTNNNDNDVVTCTPFRRAIAPLSTSLVRASRGTKPKVDHRIRATRPLRRDLVKKAKSAAATRSPLFPGSESPILYIGQGSQPQTESGLKQELKQEHRNKVRSILPRSLASHDDLEQELVWLTHNDGRGQVLTNLLHTIIHERHVQPTSIHYEALIIANCSKDYGSADNIRPLLDEMSASGIVVGPRIYSAVLRVLAVHPDPALLAEMLEACSQRWIELDATTRHYVVAAYLRSGQLELAQDAFEALVGETDTCAHHSDDEATHHLEERRLTEGQGAEGRAGPINVQPWLRVLFLRKLADHDDWEAVMRMCYGLHDEHMLEVDLPFDFWSAMLTAAVEAEDLWVTQWLWRGWVERMWIKPELRICWKTLAIAAKHAQPDLAESAASLIRHGDHEDDAESRHNEDDAEVVQTTEKAVNSDLEVDEIERLLDQAHVSAGRVRQRLSFAAGGLNRSRAGNYWWLFKDLLGLDDIKVDDQETEESVTSKRRDRNASSTNKHKYMIDPWTTVMRSADGRIPWARVEFEQMMRQGRDESARRGSQRKREEERQQEKEAQNHDSRGRERRRQHETTSGKDNKPTPSTIHRRTKARTDGTPLETGLWDRTDA